MSEPRTARVAIDIGGTFTDAVLLDETNQRVWFGKVLTTPENPGDGAAAALREIVHVSQFQGPISVCVHGTTLVANTLIERTGARVALITTRGCRDVLEIAAETTYDIYDLFAPMSEPLVPRERRFEVAERVNGAGTVVEPLDREELKELLLRIRESAPEAIAIAFLHAYRFAEHERIAREVTRKVFPGVPISLSSSVAPEIREYTRFLTTAANAYVQPKLERYLPALETGLRAGGLSGQLMLMTSSGGVSSVSSVLERPITLVESGPAGGAFVAGFLGHLAGIPDIVAFDMGGTTAKAAIIENGRPLITYGIEVARMQRFKPGSGLPLVVPSVDLIEIGAGGGSLAMVDPLGLLAVGPESASSVSGPACYGLGGTLATVTDSAVVLGYIGADSFLGGDMTLDVGAAADAIQREVATPLGLDVVAAAFGIYEVVVEQMAAAVRTYIAEHGRDQTRYTLVATGGAGPVFAYSLAKKLGMKRVLVGPGSGVASSLGLLVAPPLAERVRGYVTPLGALDAGRATALYAEMADEIAVDLATLGIERSEIVWEPVVELRYEGQGSQVRTPLPGTDFSVSELSPAAIRDRFEIAYRDLFGRTLSKGIEVDAMCWRLRGTGPTRQSAEVIEAFRSQYGHASVPKEDRTRQAYFEETSGFSDVRVVRRSSLAAGDRLQGPVLIEERESTVVVGPDASIAVDEFGILIIAIGTASA